MTDGIRWVGLDVHANQTACAVFDGATGEVGSRKIAGRPHEVLPWLLELPGPVRAVYEAGPTGYGLARRARAAGIEMQVCAPGMIAKGPGDRVKTDKRDALKLARLHAAGQLVDTHRGAARRRGGAGLSRLPSPLGARQHARVEASLLPRPLALTAGDGARPRTDP
jgi:transposase